MQKLVYPALGALLLLALGARLSTQSCAEFNRKVLDVCFKHNMTDEMAKKADECNKEFMPASWDKYPNGRNYLLTHCALHNMCNSGRAVECVPEGINKLDESLRIEIEEFMKLYKNKMDERCDWAATCIGI